MVGAGHLHEREPGEARGDGQGEDRQRPQEPRGREPAALQRGHFAVVIEPAEGENDGEQKSHRHDDRQVHDRAERDQFEHDVAPVGVLRRPAEHLRELVGHQDRDQDAGDGEPCLHDLAQHVALNGPLHGNELRAWALI